MSGCWASGWTLGFLLVLMGSGCAPPVLAPPDAGDEHEAGDPQMLHLPQRPSRVDARGPLVPGTPGLRVPAGYFTRIRLDVRDLFLPYTLGSFLRGEDGVTFRLEGVAGMADQKRVLPVFRALIPITLPSGSDIQSLTKLTLGPAAMSRGTVTIRLENGRQYLVEVERLSFEALEDGALKGSLEGKARRGMKSTTYKDIWVGFVALRAPNTGMHDADGPQPTK